MVGITESLRRRLNERLQRESMPVLAEATGIDLAIIYKFAKGQREHIRLETADTLARYLGYSGIKWR